MVDEDVRMPTTPPSDTEELRLTEIAQACQSKEHFASDQLNDPRYSMLSSTFKRLSDALATIRASCRQKTLALKTYREQRQRTRGGTLPAATAKSVSPFTDHELAIAKIVDQIDIDGTLDPGAIDGIIAKLEFVSSPEDNTFLVSYLQWRMANPIAK